MLQLLKCVRTIAAATVAFLLVAQPGAYTAAIAQTPLVATTEQQAEHMLAPRLVPGGDGIYAAGDDAAFNDLDSVVFDAGRLTLVGHRDEHYRGPRIPYLQLLAELLESPKPEFTLTGTPASSAAIDAFFNSQMSQAQGDALSRRWGQVVDSSGQVNDVGRYMLPAMGVNLVAGGRAPGFLGIGEQPYTSPVKVTSVTPGSPAAAAGVQAGDTIFTFNQATLLYPEELNRLIRFAGAGSVVSFQCMCGGQVRTLSATLTAAPDGNQWLGATRYDVMSAIYRGTGNPTAAETVHAMEMNFDFMQHYPGLGQQGLDALFIAAGVYQQVDAIRQQYQAHQLTLADAQNQIAVSLAGRLEQIFRLPVNSLLNAYLGEMRRTGNFVGAFGVMFNTFDTVHTPVFGQVLDALIFRPDGLQIAPELLDAEFHLRPQVVPEYLGVPANSQLARLMFDGDYLGKRLINRPDLAATIPGYLTSFAFEQHHPQFARTQATYRLWISVDKMNAPQSSDGRTLTFREARMRFNVRELGANGRDLPNQPGGYEELLTSLYEPLSRQYFTLHELQEAAKLAAAARWISAHDATFRLPKAGRVAWSGPTQAPGMLYFYLYPDSSRRTHVKMIAAGGVSLVPFPPGNVSNPFAGDASVVDLTQSSLVAPASVTELPAVDLPVLPGVINGAPQNSAMRRILARKICVPSPVPPAFIGAATRGSTAYQSIAVAIGSLNASPGEIDRANDLRRKLEQARLIAQHLQTTERALTILNGNLAHSAVGLAGLQSELRKDRAEFIHHAAEGLEEAGDDMRGQLELADGLNPDASSMLATMSTSKNLFDIHTFLTRLEEGGLSPEAIEKMPDGPTLDVIKKAAEEFGYHGEEHIDVSAPFSEASVIGPGGHFNASAYLEMIGDLKTIASLWHVEEDFAKLEFISDAHFEHLDAEGAESRKALEEKLLPLYRQLSAQLNAALADPAVKALLPAPKASGGCG